jgi:GntR family transcriptional repressor for pyruvate dehydrogenase complex
LEARKLVGPEIKETHMANKQPAGRVGEVIRQLEEAMLDGRFPAQSRLPSERELAQRYGVSRNTVREAIQQLGARGLVACRPRSGVYVSDRLRTDLPSPWAQLIGDSPARREDMLEFRRVLEGATAWFAALRRTDGDIARIRAALTRLEQARAEGNMADESRLDVELHEAIALASGNSMFLHLHGSIMKMLRAHITGNIDGLRELDESVSASLLQQHRTICDAICAGRAEDAQTAMQAHIDYVRNRFEVQQV